MALPREGTSLLSEFRGAVRETPAPEPDARSGFSAPPVASTTHRVFMVTAVVLDLLAVGVALFGSSLLRFEPSKVVLLGETIAGVLLVALGAVATVAFLSAGGAYDPRVLLTRREQLATLVTAVVPAWAVVQLMAFWLKVEVPFESRLVVAVSLPASLLLLVAIRFLVTRPLARRFYQRLSKGAVLVVAPPEMAMALTAELAEHDSASRKHDVAVGHQFDPAGLADLVERNDYGEVVILANGADPESVLDTAFACLDRKADVRVVSERFQTLGQRASLAAVRGLPILRLRRADLVGPEAVLKRLIDIVGAGLGLVLLGPILLLVAVAIRLDSRGPVLFAQERVGRGGRRFRMLKFRTMRHGNDSTIHENYLKQFIEGGAAADVRSDGKGVFKLTNDPRITRIGLWLRRYSIDELPQLWNVLRGEMTLVGPRPCMTYEWDLYRPWQRRRMDAAPGCTGLWQVRARSQVAFEEMVLLDLHYAHSWTPIGDLRLIAQTIPAMIRGRGGF